jgi:GTPase Era involved in 16S rRNA processing
VVVLNKIDLPHVRAKSGELVEALLSRMGHTRVLEISAAARENTRELMQRVRRLLDKVDAQSGHVAQRPTTVITPLDERTGVAMEVRVIESWFVNSEDSTLLCGLCYSKDSPLLTCGLSVVSCQGSVVIMLG